MADCSNCKYALLDYEEYYNTTDKQWFVEDCKKDMPDAECCPEFEKNGRKTMAEYIERDASLAVFHDWIDKHGDVHTVDEIPEYEAIENIPAAVVRPVRYGKWIMNDNSRTVCSLCGNVVGFVSHPDKRWDFGYFCSNCSADMREKS